MGTIRFPENHTHMMIDIHSHRLDANPSVFRIYNLMLRQPPYPALDTFQKTLGMSAGIHPWNTLEWDGEVNKLESVFESPKVLLIGEIGLDKRCPVPFDKQQILFENQAILAGILGKPVILHVVRALAELIAVKKKQTNVPTWIIHGFRGGRQEAEQCVSNGFFLSFGQTFNSGGLEACPLDKLFVETDESGDINAIYSVIAREKQLTTNQLEAIVSDNFNRTFPKVTLLTESQLN
jgi:TatD DNase family protein